MAELQALTGGCHCGNLGISFHTRSSPGDLNPRACDCSFCKKHGALYVSDPSGRLIINVKDSDALTKYRQGSGTADFLVCRRCGVLVGAIWERDASISAAVNARCLQRHEEFAEPVVVSPQKLGKEEKTARWETLWTRDVQISTSDR
jgi:hypothetical protein